MSTSPRRLRASSSAPVSPGRNTSTEPRRVSRNPEGEGQISYEALNSEMFREFDLIVNATPVGMYPGINECPPIPYGRLTPEHTLYDLVYNPDVTKFLMQGAKAGARVKNGLEMLYLQADFAWSLWNDIPYQNGISDEG